MPLNYMGWRVAGVEMAGEGTAAAAAAAETAGDLAESMHRARD